MINLNAHLISKLEQQANEGNAQAQFDLAMYYADKYYADGRTRKERDLDLAFEWNQKAAEQGYAKAQLSLGLYLIINSPEFEMYEGDKGSMFSPLLNIFRTTTLLDNLLSAYAKYYIHSGIGQNKKPFFNGDINIALGLTLFNKAVEQGLAEAQFWLACMYDFGVGVEQNDKLAFIWHKKAAEQNIAQSKYCLARYYLAGKSVEQNQDSALKWLFDVIEQTEAYFKTIKYDRNCYKEASDAYMLLGDLYAEGKVIEKNDKLAIKWYKKAIENNYCEIDETETSALYNTAAEQGLFRDEVLFFEIKESLMNDLGELIEAVKANHVKAKQWLEETYLNAVFPAFTHREDVTQCYKFAFEWLLNKYQNNSEDFEVNFALGVLYAFGKSTEINQELAVDLFTSCQNICHNECADYDDLRSLFYEFSELYCDLSKGIIPKYYYQTEQLAPYFLNTERCRENAVLPTLIIDFYIHNGEFELAKEFLNTFMDKESSFYEKLPALKKNFTQVSMIAIEYAEQLEEKNKQLQEKEKDLEDMMSMFAHKFRSPLDAIIYNTTHDNQVKLYAEAAQTMRGLLNIFSIISTDDTILKDKIKQDCQGNGQLETVFSKTLDMILLHLLSVSGAEKIQQHYLNYAKTQGQCDAQLSYKTWCEEYFEVEQVLQTQWEADFAQLINQSASLEQRLAWLEQHFFKLEITGFNRADIQFKEYGITESLLTILLNEILVNAFKYYSSASNQSVLLEWTEREDYQVLICRNPSIRSERSIIKGSHKGHVFLSTLARKTGSLFNKPMPHDAFVLEFGIPNELLISK